jgi:hypothetical protein
MTEPHDGHDGWVRLASPSESPAPGLTASRVAVAVLPAAAAVIVLRRRARRRARQSAWRYRTQGEISTENQRLVVAHQAAETDPDAPAGRPRPAL